MKETKVRSWEDVIDRENPHSGSGAGERTVKALTERTPTTKKVRAALGNMMIWSVVRENR